MTTCSSETAVAAGFIPPQECMFKGTYKGRARVRLEEYRRRAGFPAWLTVTMSDSGSYKESDAVAFLKAHLEEWKEGCDWRIIFADWYSAQTPVAQTPDTDLNEEVRRLYGNKESAVLMEKMRQGQSEPKMTQEECMVLMEKSRGRGQTVPKLTHEECVELMHSAPVDSELHKKAAQGYKKVEARIRCARERGLIVTLPPPRSPPWMPRCVICGEGWESMRRTWHCRECHRTFCIQHIHECDACKQIWCVNCFDEHRCDRWRRHLHAAPHDPIDN
jgi:hypothetical protein